MSSVIFSEVALYLCLSILMGSFILSIVPNHHRPSISVGKKYMILAAIGVGLFSFSPVLIRILNLQQRVDWQGRIQTVLLTFEIGKAWIFTTIVMLILLLFIAKFHQREDSKYSWIGCILTIFLIMGLAWSSHASTSEQIIGFLTHFVHVTAVTVWVGILFVISWFSKNQENWLQFLRWFTPIAISCVLVTAASGIVLMTFVIDLSQYPNSWMVDYGQFLLIKHILIMVLLAYAFVNGILIRRRLREDETFNPVPWVKAESIVALLIFSATAAMSQQSPPSAGTLEHEGLSFLFELFYQGQYYSGMDVQMSVNSISILLITIAFLFLALLFYAFIKKASSMITLVLSIFFVLSSYLALIMSVS
ncbi:copper resistance D family protein [Bacillus sp. FJAT-27986]|uniref:copper resistance D family protein n=1 Tax=Bacillus sp. FJAT-27986 TaxID=1743146 RepID=UPI00080AE4EE|nr:CopD family protein [Bacillus sp. FJAT-27986]OCA86674.1 copper resistance protein CopD [Bacillus sp. FJAT-27986]